MSPELHMTGQMDQASSATCYPKHKCDLLPIKSLIQVHKSWVQWHRIYASPSYGCSFMSRSWVLRFWDGYQIFGKL